MDKSEKSSFGIDKSVGSRGFIKWIVTVSGSSGTGSGVSSGASDWSIGSILISS